MLPTFNLLANVWWAWTPSPAYPAGPPDLINLACNLQLGRKHAMSETVANNIQPWLLVPALTDIRSAQCYPQTAQKYDVVEVPAGTGRMYVVEDVEDVSKGFPAEYRVAFLAKGPIFDTMLPVWPIPIP